MNQVEKVLFSASWTNMQDYKYQKSFTGEKFNCFGEECNFKRRFTW